MLGGVDKQEKVLRDMWILDVDSGKWTEVRILVNAYIRFPNVRYCRSIKNSVPLIVGLFFSNLGKHYTVVTWFLQLHLAVPYAKLA